MPIELGSKVDVSQGYGTRDFSGEVVFILGDACEVRAECSFGCGGEDSTCRGCGGDGTEIYTTAIKNCTLV